MPSNAPRTPSAAAQCAGPGFPRGSTLEQTGPETWLLVMPGPTEEELRYTHTFPPQTLTWKADASRV